MDGDRTVLWVLGGFLALVLAIVAFDAAAKVGRERERQETVRACVHDGRLPVDCAQLGAP